MWIVYFILTVVALILLAVALVPFEILSLAAAAVVALLLVMIAFYVIVVYVAIELVKPWFKRVLEFSFDTVVKTFFGVDLTHLAPAVSAVAQEGKEALDAAEFVVEHSETLGVLPGMETVIGVSNVIVNVSDFFGSLFGGKSD